MLFCLMWRAVKPTLWDQAVSKCLQLMHRATCSIAEVIMLAGSKYDCFRFRAGVDVFSFIKLMLQFSASDAMIEFWFVRSNFHRIRCDDGSWSLGTTSHSSLARLECPCVGLKADRSHFLDVVKILTPGFASSRLSFLISLPTYQLLV